MQYYVSKWPWQAPTAQLYMLPWTNASKYATSATALTQLPSPKSLVVKHDDRSIQVAAHFKQVLVQTLQRKDWLLPSFQRLKVGWWYWDYKIASCTQKSQSACPTVNNIAPENTIHKLLVRRPSFAFSVFLLLFGLYLSSNPQEYPSNPPTGHVAVGGSQAMQNGQRGDLIRCYFSALRLDSFFRGGGHGVNLWGLAIRGTFPVYLQVGNSEFHH